MKELQREDEDLPGTEQPRQAGVCQARGPWGVRIRVRVEHGATSEQEGLVGLRTPHGNRMVRGQASQPREQREQRRGGQEETDEGRLKVQLEGGGAWSRATAPRCKSDTAAAGSPAAVKSSLLFRVEDKLEQRRGQRAAL